MSSPMIDSLEDRRMFAAGPLITSALFVGDHNAVTALVIGFDRPLEETSAETLSNFALQGSRNGGRVDDLLFAAATYNPTDYTVTLTRTDLYSLRFFRRMTVVARGNVAGHITDTSGNLLDGDRDGQAGQTARFTFKVHRSRGLAYRDDDGDRVKLKARGAEGRRPLFALSYKGSVHQAWLDGFNNTLTGTIKKTNKSDGVTSIGRVVLIHPSNVNALSSSFVVGQTVQDGQAPVDPQIRTFPATTD